jgi:hypothetical protein
MIEVVPTILEHQEDFLREILDVASSRSHSAQSVLNVAALGLEGGAAPRER